MSPGSTRARLRAATPHESAAATVAPRPTTRRLLGSVQRQLTALVVVMGVIILVVLAALLLTVRTSNREAAFARSINQARADLGLASAQLLTGQTAMLRYVNLPSADTLADLEHSSTQFGTYLQGVRTHLIAAGESPDKVDRLGAIYRSWYAQDVIPTLALVADGRLIDARTALSDTAVHFQGFQLEMNKFWADLSGVFNQAAARTVELRGRVTWMVVGLLGVVVAALAVASMIVRLAVVRPLRRLQEAARRVAAGAWDETVSVRGPDEIVELAADVEQLRAGLMRGMANERRAAEALDQNGPAVVALREALFSAPLAHGAFESCGRLDPVEGVLAGDWWETIDLGADRAAVIVGDVAGHGAGSGVYALRLKGLLRASLLDGRGPAEAIAHVAAQVRRNPDNDRVARGELFATVFLGIVDRTKNEVVYASAGHLDAVLLRAVHADDGTALAPFDQIDLPATGPMLSTLLLGRGWRERRHAYGPADVVVVATDGVMEARDETGDAEYGPTALLAALAPALAPGRPLAAGVDAVFDGVARFEPQARDDRTLVAVRYRTHHVDDHVVERVSAEAAGSMWQFAGVSWRTPDVLPVVGARLP